MRLTRSEMAILVALLLLLAAGVASDLYYRNHPGRAAAQPPDPTNPNILPGIQTSSAPWPPEIDHLRGRLRAIGLPALPEEGTALHIHQHLDLSLHGQWMTVPAGIGINERDRFISPIHTHDPTGIIHVESPTIQSFYLGQFFDIWGVRFTSQCIGGDCEDGRSRLRVFVNGGEMRGSPRSIRLAAHQEIVVTFGASDELPNPIPSQYSFPPGL